MLELPNVISLVTELELGSVSDPITITLLLLEVSISPDLYPIITLSL